MKQPLPKEPTLFDLSPSLLSTSTLAGQTAARYSSERYRQILDHLRRHGPSTLFEIASALGCHDHQISGRITELVRNCIIERTKDRRRKPETGCWADVLKLAEGL